MKTVLVYGDSNSHGTVPLTALGEFNRYPPGQPWPDVMAAELGDGVRVINESLPGRTTVHDDVVEGGMRNGLTVLPAALHSHRPLDLMVLMLGTNDLKTRFSVTPFEIAQSVQRLIVASRAEGILGRIVVVCPPPVRELGVLAPVFAGAEARQPGLSGQYERVANAQGCGFVDAGEHVAVSDTDGVHWEADAHRAFGEAMARVVSGQLERGA